MKLLLTGTIGAGFLMSTGCQPADIQEAKEIIISSGYGRTPDEILHDENLNAETFFTDHEMKMVEVLSDIIIPADEHSGSATDEGVPAFIEFMMKDYPKFQLPMRGGLMWLDNLSRKTFDKSFTKLDQNQRISIIDKIAWPDKAEDDMKFGVKFFNLMRNLTCTGYFTTKNGFRDLGYVGNSPNQWNGAPKDVLQKHGLSYNDSWSDLYLKIEDQHKVAEWDDDGNLI